MILYEPDKYPQFIIIGFIFGIGIGNRYRYEIRHLVKLKVIPSKGQVEEPVSGLELIPFKCDSG